MFNSAQKSNNAILFYGLTWQANNSGTRRQSKLSCKQIVCINNENTMKFEAKITCQDLLRDVETQNFN